MKKVFLATLLFLPVFHTTTVQAASPTPTVGKWDFCVTETDIGCVESFKTTDDNNQPISITSENERLPYSELSFDMNCSSLSTNQSQCDSKANTPRDPRGVSACGFTEPAKLTGHARWTGRAGRGFQMTVRTGDFDPAFSFGNGITGTSRIANPDGTYKFVWTGIFDEIKTANIPTSLTSGPLATNYDQLLKEFFATATVGSAILNSIIYVLPAAYLRVGLPGEKVNGVWVQECKDLPMKGMWVEANAQMFSYLVGFYGKSKQAASKFSFAASSPHFLPGGTELNPARFNMFIPDSYVTSIGYSTESFTLSALKLTVADNQIAKPVLTRRTGGFGLDFGIAHYSSPNPELEILNANWTETETSLPLATTPTSTTTTLVSVTVPATTPLGVTAKVQKTLSGNTLAKSAGLAIPKKAKISVTMSSKYAKRCRISGTSIKTLTKGTCVVKVSVTTVTKKKTSKSLTITVK